MIRRTLSRAGRLVLAVMLLLSLGGLPAPADEVPSPRSMSAVVLVNSASAGFGDYERYIEPYLEHFGVPLSVVDIANTQVAVTADSCALVIIGHRSIDIDGTYLSASEQQSILDAVSGGAGLLSFDGDLAGASGAPRYQWAQTIFGLGYGDASGAQVSVPAVQPVHYITGAKPNGASVALRGTISSKVVSAPSGDTVLATLGSSPLLVSTQYGQGRAVQWASYDWMKASVLGPMYGLDDLVWRGVVWAARKPFAMQSIPAMVTMRVDDVKGAGIGSDSFGWVKTANAMGWKPWSGLFINEIGTNAGVAMRSLVHGGAMTAGVHARTGGSFAYYDHSSQRPFSDSTIQTIFGIIDAFYAQWAIPMSTYVVPHHYEIGGNAFPQLQARGVKYLGVTTPPGTTYASSADFLIGPFRRFEAPGANTASHPLYFGDYLSVPDHPELADTFFNVVTEIRDNDGYEWYPTNNSASNTSKGVAQLKRALDSRAVATLFTHENYLEAISPTAWQASFDGIRSGIAGYEPRYLTMDSAAAYAEAVHNSSLSGATYAGGSTAHLTMAGTATVPTEVQVFVDGPNGIKELPTDVPAFGGSVSIDAPVVEPSTPMVTEVLPASGSVAAETPVVIRGRGFTNAGSVRLGDPGSTPLEGVTVVSDSEIRATVPPDVSVGAWDVLVTTSSGANSRSHMTFAAVGASADAAPSVAISSPSSGQTVYGTVNVSAQATDDTGVARVEFYVDGVLRAADSVAPYAFTWNSSTDLGGRTLMAKAVDVAGNTATATVSVTVVDVRNVALASNGGSVGGYSRQVTNGPATGLIDGVATYNTDYAAWMVGSPSGTEYVTLQFDQAYTIDHVVHVNDGQHGARSVTIQASDDGQSWRTVSTFNGLSALTGQPSPDTLSFEPTNARFLRFDYTTFNDSAWLQVEEIEVFGTPAVPDITPPDVSITAPTAYAAVSGVVNLSASASDDVGVRSVEFLVDGNLVHSALTAPYSATWNSASVANGDHVIAARATDITGNVATASLTVTTDNMVQIPAPTVSSLLPSSVVNTGTATIRILGTGLTGATEVRLSDAASTALGSLTPISDTELWGTVPAGVVPGSYDVLVTTGAGTSSGGAKLTVTSGSPVVLTPVTINCANDASQHPALTTFTNPSLLTPAAWNEFLYSPRGFAGVFGHTSNKSLPTMEFFAPAANGTYALTANVYGQPGRTYRYFYGLSAANPLAYSVDVPPASDFTVVPLGSVTVTNGHFSIFVQRADLLSGTDYYFGWASLTLTPTSPPAVPVPAVSALQPSSVVNTGTATIRILGTGLTGATAVRLSDAVSTPLGALSPVSDIELGATVPAGVVPGMYDVVVTTPGGASVGGAKLTVTAANHAPVAAADAYTTAEDTALTIATPGVLGNDSDSDGNTLAASVVSQPAHGTLTLAASGSFTYTPAANWSGTDTYTYRVFDGAAYSGNAVVTITVSATNDAPVAVADAYSTPRDSALTISAPGVLGNDSDVEGTALSASVVALPAHGTLVLNASGALLYTPAADYSGTDTFTYRASDGAAFSAPAIVTITVTPVNHAPVAAADAYTTAEDTALTITAPGVLGNDSDADGNTLSASVVSQPTHGTLSLGANGSFTYTPAGNWSGSDTYTYRVFDGAAYSGNAVVTITVSATNDIPVAVADAYTTAEDVALTIAAPGVLGNDTDVEGASLSATVVSQPAHGALTLGANGAFTYTPAANWNGTDTYTYRAWDGAAYSGNAVATITVTAANDAPVAVADTYTTVANVALTIAAPGVLANDTDIEGAALSASVVAQPAHGTLALNANGSFTYTPAADWNGVDMYTYRAWDGAAYSSSVAVTITVTAPPVIPVPTVTSLLPSGVLNNTPTAIRILGTGFAGASVVRLSDGASTVLGALTPISDTEVRATVPAGVVPGNYDVLVTTPGGTSTGGARLTVAAPAPTPVPVTISCSADANQSPVLTTFTNAGLLSASSWNEFWYGGRAYAGVFGYTSNKSLPTLEFFAPVANGTYTLTANLYGQPGRTYRYFYGFSAESPASNSVDVAAQSDFAMKTLGTVVVTNGRFSLFVQRADLLSGTDYYFGWASLTLTPIAQ